MVPLYIPTSRYVLYHAPFSCQEKSFWQILFYRFEIFFSGEIIILFLLLLIPGFLPGFFLSLFPSYLGGRGRISVDWPCRECPAGHQLGQVGRHGLCRPGDDPPRQATGARRSSFPWRTVLARVVSRLLNWRNDALSAGTFPRMVASRGLCRPYCTPEPIQNGGKKWLRELR